MGGTVWARAEAISLDYKRILGSQFKTKWIEGSVVSVEKRKALDAAKRSTTYVEGKYPCGVDSTTKTQLYKVKFLSLQTLKAKDPFAVENVPPTLLPPPAPTQATTGTTIHATAVAAAPTENVQPTENPLTPPTAPEGRCRGNSRGCSSTEYASFKWFIQFIIHGLNQSTSDHFQ